MAELPPALLSKHPELASVGEALEQLRLGQPIRCPGGHTHVRMKHAPVRRTR